jgi:hypothetical protein
MEKEIREIKQDLVFLKIAMIANMIIVCILSINL